MTLLLVTTGALMVALLSVAAGIGTAADATWKTHQDQNCGVETRVASISSMSSKNIIEHVPLESRK